MAGLKYFWSPIRGVRQRSSRGRALVAALLALSVGVAWQIVALRHAVAAPPSSSSVAPGAIDQNSGAFTSSMSIDTPKFHGIEPNLALVYNSSGGGSAYGLGWQLAGESRVERAAPGRGAPAFTASDVFLLDGEQLVASTVLGGTHVTKRQGFRRISFDSVANVWNVWDKDGTHSTYATTLTPVAGHPLRWMLSSVTDLHGNVVSYGYWCDGVFECYLNTVSYNGTVVTLYREARPDVVSRAGGGTMLRIAYRVKTIDVSVGASRARAYKLTYIQSPTTGRSLLASVQRFGRDATLDTTGTVTGGSAMPAVKMTMTSDVNSFDTETIGMGNWCGGSTDNDLNAADFNGDGKDDLYCYNSVANTVKVALSDGVGGFTGGGQWLSGWCGGKTYGTGDFNGDGKADLWCRTPATGTIFVAISDGVGSFIGGTVASTIGVAGKFCAGTTGVAFGTGDFNGDGKTDIYCHDYLTANTWVALSDAAGGGNFATATIWSTGLCLWTTNGNLHFDAFDFNGDGKADAWCHDWLTGNDRIGVSDGVGAFVNLYTWETSWCLAGSLGVGDFNGDGRTDMWCLDSSTANMRVDLSNGRNGFADGTVWRANLCDRPPSVGIVFTVEQGDVNGDGTTDFQCHNNSYFTTTVTLSNGYNAFNALTLWKPAWCSGAQKWFLADVNGDGKPDMLCHSWSTVSGITQVSLAGSYGRADLLSSITNEQGGITSVAYLPATKWPNTLLPPGRPPMVVSQIVVDNGAGARVSTNYDYSGGRWDPLERRFLGFEHVTATDAVSGARTVTTFRVLPDYPANRAVQVDHTDASGAVLSRTQTTYNESSTGGVFTSLVSAKLEARCTSSAMCQSSLSDFAYDGYGNVVLRSDFGDAAFTGDERSTLTTFTYDTTAYLVNTPSVVTVRAGMFNTLGGVLRQSSFGYDAAGDVTSTGRLLTSNNTTVTTSSGFDAYGNQTSSTDELGNTTTYAYDPTFHTYQTQSCNALSQCSAQAWDTVLGLATSATDTAGQVISWSYDPLGRRAVERRPDGSTTATIYVNWGIPGSQYQQDTVSDGTLAGLWKQTFVDGIGHTIKTVRAPDITVVTTYNSQGLVAAVSNPFHAGQAAVYTSYTYDTLGRQVSLTNPDNTVVTTSYGVLLNAADADFATAKLTETRCDETGACRRLAYDGYGNNIVTSEWNGTAEYRTHAAYDLLSQLTQVRDAAGNVMTQAWDSLGRKTSMSDPDAGTWSYGYDNAGHVTSQTDPRGVVVVSGYDALGRPTTQTSGTTVLSTSHYDEAGHGAGTGRLTSMTDPSGSTSIIYDGLGRVTSTVRTVGTTSYTVSESYDRAGRRSSLTYPDGEVVTNTYDTSGCLSTVGGYVTAASCTPSMTMATRTLGNGVKEVDSYDANRLWLTGDTIIDAAAAVLQNETYGHNARGQVSSKTSSDTADQWTYTYDPLGRLMAAANTTIPAYSGSYTYDPVGRITSGSGMGTMTYPSAGLAHPHAPTTVGAATYTYDAAGERTGDGTSTFAYDQLGRLAATTTGGVTTSYVYDGANHRVKAGNITFVGMDGQILYTTDGTAATKYYYYGTQRVARKDSGGTVYYYAGDHLGSPHLILSATGTVVRQSIFSPYGAVLSQTGTVTDPFGLTGRYRDTNGTYKLGKRYLAPTAGAFLTPDTSGKLDPSAPQTLNRYSYAQDDPINMVDPSGERATSSDGLEHPFGITVSADPGHAVSFDVDLHGNTFALMLPTEEEPGRLDVGPNLSIGEFANVNPNVGVQFRDGSIVGGDLGGSVNAGIPYLFSAGIKDSANFTVSQPTVTEFGTQTTITMGLELAVKGGIFGGIDSETKLFDWSGQATLTQYAPETGSPTPQPSEGGADPATTLTNQDIANLMPGLSSLTGSNSPWGNPVDLSLNLADPSGAAATSMGADMLSTGPLSDLSYLDMYASYTDGLFFNDMPDPELANFDYASFDASFFDSGDVFDSGGFDDGSDF
jgi:RHS repeat-associated protein